MIREIVEIIQLVLWTRDSIGPFPEEITLSQYYLPEELIADDIRIDEYDQNIVWEVEEEIVSATFDTGVRCKNKCSEKVCWQEIGEKEGWV